MQIYVASSWRNTFQPTVVQKLRSAGHIVYDFKNPNEASGFGWKEVTDDANALKNAAFFRDEVLTHPRARQAFDVDMRALRHCDACVLVLPCGRSAHLELGWAVGANRKTLVLLDALMSEPELMYLMTSAICTSLDEVVNRLAHPLQLLRHA